MPAILSPSMSAPLTKEIDPILAMTPAKGCRRKIDPNAGRALEVLGHAIEYLTDEFVFEGAWSEQQNSRLQAVQLLMAVNRQIYFECPEVPTFGQKVLSILGVQGR